MEHTEYYQLSLWEQDDRIQMEDFNADNQKIDAALATMPRIVTGTYTGDGAETRTISLGFTPKAVYVCRADGATFYRPTSSNTVYCGGLALRDSPIVQEDITVLGIVTGGFRVANQHPSSYVNYATNGNQTVYRYVALA